MTEDIKRYLNNFNANKNSSTLQLSVRLKELEKTLILEALIETNYNISSAALLLGIERSNLSKKIKNYNINISLLKK